MEETHRARYRETGKRGSCGPWDLSVLSKSTPCQKDATQEQPNGKETQGKIQGKRGKGSLQALGACLSLASQHLLRRSNLRTAKQKRDTGQDTGKEEKGELEGQAVGPICPQQVITSQRGSASFTSGLVVGLWVLTKHHSLQMQKQSRKVRSCVCAL